MPDGSQYAGVTRHQRILRFPAWIHGEHNGSIRIFVQTLNNVGYFISQVRPLQTPHHNIGRMRLYIQQEGDNFLHANLEPMGNEQPPQNARGRVYVGLPDGRKFSGYVV